MRQAAGFFTLIAGLLALALAAAFYVAPGIEAAVRAQSKAVLDVADQPPQAAVSGRDVVVTGVARDPAERADILAALSDVSAIRRVDAMALRVLPQVDPYWLSVVKQRDGQWALDGTLPTAAFRDQLTQRFGPAVAHLPLASGAPDRAWSDAVTQVIAALDVLEGGQADFFGRDIAVNGVALLPDAAEKARASLDDLPSGYVLDVKIETLDDGSPHRLVARLNAGVIDLSGKLPAQVARAQVAQFVRQAGAEPGAVDLAAGVLPAAQPDWDGAAEQMLAAVAALRAGEAQLEQGRVRIAGAGSPDAIETVRTRLQAVPDGFEAHSDITLYGLDIPFQLTARLNGAAVELTGHLPAGFAPDWSAEWIVTDRAERLFHQDEIGHFTQNVAAAMAALAQMRSGEMTVGPSDLTLSGAVDTLRAAAQVDVALSGVAAGAQVTRDLQVPAAETNAWALRFDPVTGARIDGRLPEGLTGDALADALGLPSVAVPQTTAPPPAREDSQVVAVIDMAAQIAPFLAQIETLSYLSDERGRTLDILLAPGHAPDVLAAELAVALPVDVSFSVGPSAEHPSTGDARLNVVSGQTERFDGSQWQPRAGFDVTPAQCNAQTRLVLDATPLTFLSGSADLDGSAAHGLARLAGVARICAAEGLLLEVAGHTDATGDPDQNLALSQARAQAVRDGLTRRGVAPDMIEAYGFGSTMPIADNDTELGRAANRRTDFSWFTPGGIRDP